MKKLLLLALTVIGLLFVGGCGNGASSVSSNESTKVENVENAEEVISEESQASTTEETPKEVTKKDAERAMKDLIKRGREYAESEDKEGIKSLLTGDVNQDKFDDIYNAFKKYNDDNYPYEEYDVIYGKDNIFLVDVVTSVSRGEFPNYNGSAFPRTYLITYVDNNWKFLYDDLGVSLIEKFPNECIEAMEADRNCITFSWNGTNTQNNSWINNSYALKGQLCNNVCLAWQNEDGSVDVVYTLMNGFDFLVSYKSVEITLTSKKAGEIISVTEVPGMMSPNSSKNFTVHVDADDVLTGTKDWGGVFPNIRCLSEKIE